MIKIISARTTNPEVRFNENVVATLNLLEAMRRKSVEELVFASSSSVYGEPEEIPVGEDAPHKARASRFILAGYRITNCLYSIEQPTSSSEPQSMRTSASLL